MLWEWQIGELERLASYVVPNAFEGSGDLPGRVLALRSLEKRAEAIYNRLTERELTYTGAPYEPKPGRQQIRQPGTVFTDGRGTCLELTLIFAALCITAELRPLLAVIKQADGGSHALVILPSADLHAAAHEVWPNPFSSGVCRDLGWSQLSEYDWLAVDAASAAGPPGCAPVAFSESVQLARHVLERARKINLVDVAFLHRLGYEPVGTSQVPPRRATRTYRGSGPDQVPITLGDDIRQAYNGDVVAAALAANLEAPTVWTAESLRPLLVRDVASPELDTVCALVDALVAKPVFEALGGGEVPLGRLQQIYQRKVGTWPTGGTSDALLVEAAAAWISERRRSPGEPLSVLACFMLGVAADRRRPAEHPVLSKWIRDVLGHQLGDARDHLASECSEPVWALIDLGDEPVRGVSPTGSVPWPEQISVVLHSRAGPEPPIWQDCEPSAAGLLAGLRALLRRLPTERPLLVDLAAPRALLDQGIEHWPLVEWDEEYEELSAHHRPRLRWSKRRADLRLHQVLVERTHQARWGSDPVVVPDQDAARLRTWLHSCKNHPYLLGSPSGRGDTLRVLLREGCGFILWFPSGITHQTATRLIAIAKQVPPAARRDRLPGEFADLPPDLTGGRPVVIWDDPLGREGFRLAPRVPLQNPGGAT